MGQHDARRTDIDFFGSGRDRRDHHFRCRACKGMGVVMFGKPIALVAETFSVFGKIDCVAQGLGSRAAVADRRLVENAESNHHKIFLDRPAFDALHNTAEI